MVYFDPQITVTLTSAGLLLAVLGFLNLVYELLERQPKWLERGVWNLSSGVVVASAVVTVYGILLEMRILSLGVSSDDLVRAGWIIGMFAIFIQFFKFEDMVSKPPNPPVFIWQNMLIPMIFPGPAIGALGAFLGGVVGGVILGTVGAVTTGLMAGFSQGLQWRAKRLPEKRLAVIGTLLIGLGLLLVLIGPTADLLDYLFP